MRLLGFVGLLLLVGALGWWVTSTQATHAGVVASAAASVLALVGMALALRRSILVALWISVAGMVVRLGTWFAGYRWVRAQHQDVRDYTFAFLGVFVVALCLEMTYVLAAARGQRRGAT